MKTIFAAGMVLALATAASAEDLKKVSFAAGGGWSPAESFMPFGKALGFFAEEGIDLDLIGVEGAGVMVPQLATGAIDFGLPPPEYLAIAAGKGEAFPVKMIYSHYTANPFEFVVLADSPLQGIADLKGKKLGVGALSWGNLPMTRVYLHESGAEWEKDVTPIPVGVGPAAWKQLTEGTVDALNLFVHQHAMMEANGIALRRLPLPEAYAGVMGNGVATSDKMIAENPELVGKFLRAFARSGVACMAQPEACASAYWAFDPATKPTDAEREGWLKLYGGINAAAQAKAHSHAQPGKLGEYTPEGWAALIGALTAGGQLAAPVDPAALYTTAFIAAANDFDVAATEAAAAAYKAE